MEFIKTNKDVMLHSGGPIDQWAWPQQSEEAYHNGAEQGHAGHCPIVGFQFLFSALLEFSLRKSREPFAYPRTTMRPFLDLCYRYKVA